LLKQLQQKTKYLFLISLLSLSALLVLFSDLYLFSKFVTIPPWIEQLPKPFSYFGFPGFTRVAIFICLMPIAFAKEKLIKSSLLVLKTVVLSVIPVIITHSIEIIPNFSDYRDWGNIPYQYLWIIVFHYLIPVLSVMLIIYLKASLEKYYK
jgi:hypothetical protein